MKLFLFYLIIGILGYTTGVCIVKAIQHQSCPPNKKELQKIYKSRVDK